MRKRQSLASTQAIELSSAPATRAPAVYQLKFDYSQIEDVAISEAAQADAIEILDNNRTAAERLLDTGRRLAENKERLPHGLFLPWIETEFEFTPRTATNLINAWRRFGEEPETAQLFAPTVLQLLAAPSTPTEVVDAAVSIATNGGTIRKQDVAALKNGTPVSLADGYDGDQWGTPVWLLDAAADVMGDIDLDPASNETAQAIIDAGAYYTADDDGLDPSNPWAGRVFLNPPYSKPAPWIERVCGEYAAGNVDQAIVLVNNASDTAWYQRIAGVAAKCDLFDRVKFLLDGQEHGGARQGQTVFYLGENVARFREVFDAHGNVYAAPVTVYDRPPLKSENAADGAGEDRPSLSVPLRMAAEVLRDADDHAVLRLSLDLICWIADSVPFAPPAHLVAEFDATFGRLARERQPAPLEPTGLGSPLGAPPWGWAWTETDQLAWDLLPGDWTPDDITTPAICLRLFQEGDVDTEQEAEILHRRYQQLRKEQG